MLSLCSVTTWQVVFFDLIVENDESPEEQDELEKKAYMDTFAAQELYEIRIEEIEVRMKEINVRTTRRP